MSPAKTAKDRQKEWRDRSRVVAGGPEVRGIFSHLDDHSEVKEAAARINRRRARGAKRATEAQKA